MANIELGCITYLQKKILVKLGIGLTEILFVFNISPTAVLWDGDTAECLIQQTGEAEDQTGNPWFTR